MNPAGVRSGPFGPILEEMGIGLREPQRTTARRDGLPFRASRLSIPGDDFSVDHLRWIIRLRWFALGGILAAALAGLLGWFPGVNARVMLGLVAVAGVYNLFAWRRLRTRSSEGTGEALRQAIADMGLLTLVLWACGGMRTPFIGYYLFHVAILGILGGKRAAIVAGAAALLGALVLLVTEYVPVLQIGRWDPIWPWDVLAEMGAFVTTVAAVAYLVTNAVNELRIRERMLAEARDRAALELEVLTTTLDELEAGLEVVEAGSGVLWRNKRAEELAPASSQDPERWACPGDARRCERDPLATCPVEGALETSEAGVCRFAARVGDRETVYEMQVFPLGRGPEGGQRVMNLYIDRTRTLMAEQRLVLAERLASLGRVTQGVAHELNTPLATIRTLAKDMVAALKTVDEPARERTGLFDDLHESAELVYDETRRLGRITQGLLTGRDLTAPRIEGTVPLAAVVERARALVFAGARGDVPIEVGEGLGTHYVSGDPDQLVQVFVNLLQNAHDAVREGSGGGVRVMARREEQSVVISIEDDGPGVPPAIENRLFEPFATTKPPGKGTGLGLYTSYMLVDAMRGHLQLENREQGGARARVALPAAGVSSPRAAHEGEAAE